MNKNKLKAVVFLIFFSGFSFGVTIPSLSGPVVDTVGVINEKEKSILSEGIRDYFQKNGVQYQVLFIDSLEGESIDVFSIRVAEEWKIGKKDGTGVIIVAAISDRKIRIEVGQGLEGSLTDIFCSRIIRNVVAPQFRKNQYGLGIAAALTMMSKELGNEISFSNTIFSNSYKYHSSSKRSGFSFFWIIILFFILRGILFNRGGGCLTGFLFGSLLGGTGRRSGSGFGGGGFSGGGWSGGGGGFSGGGASGGW